MMFSPRRKLKSAVIVAAAAAAAMTLSQNVAFAQEPGESSNWQQEHTPDGNALHATGTFSEARDTRNNIAQTWRSDDGLNNVWVLLPGTGVLAQPFFQPQDIIGMPRVVQYGNGFRIFFTGVNHHIYMSHTFFADSNQNTVSQLAWNDTGLTSPYSPAVANLGGSENSLIAVVFTSNDDNHNPMFIRWDGFHSQWTSFFNFGGNAVSGPSVVYDEASARIGVGHVGETGNLYMSFSRVSDTGVWTPWSNYGGQFLGTVALAATANGNVAVAGRAPDTSIWFARLDDEFQFDGNYSKEIKGWESDWDPNLTINNTGDAYALLTGKDGDTVWFKKAMDK